MLFRSANNVTYGAAGDTIGYWKFFPAREDAQNDWGCLPVWGFATIVGSILDGLIEGERVYGYFPPADFLVMRPIKLTSGRFVDGSIHRAELPAVYNNYVRLDNESGYDQSVDNIRALLNPLHITSFCLCDALKSETFYGAEQIIVLSASSKTAIGMAQGLLDSGVSPEILGITSRSNYDFVRSLAASDDSSTISAIFLINSNDSSGDIFMKIGPKKFILLASICMELINFLIFSSLCKSLRPGVFGEEILMVM